MPKSKKKYSGDLAKPIPRLNALVALLQHSTLDEELGRIRAKKMLMLFKHYGISFDPREDWASLAIVLALDHVPGFSVSESKQRGRPRTSIKTKSEKSRGRPRGLTDDAELMLFIDEIKRRHELQGRGSEKRALERFIEYCAEPGESVITLKDKHLKKLQKRLSTARNRNSEK